MKTKLLTIFEKWANWKSILALFALQMLFTLVIMPSASSSGKLELPILDLHFWYTPQQAYQIIADTPPELRQIAAITHLTLDIIYPIVYGLLICLILIVTFRWAFPKSRFADAAIFVPWSGVLFDYLENFGLATMYLSYPTELIPLAWATAVFTSLKWTLIGVGFGLVLIGGVKLTFTKK